MLKVLAGVVVSLVIAAIAWGVAHQPTYDPKPLPSSPTLQKRKLVQDIAKERRDDSDFARLVAFLTPLAPVLVAAATLWQATTRAIDDRREQRRQFQTTRFDDRFTESAKNLASDNEGEQAGAAVLLMSLIKDRTAELSEQASNLLVSSLQLEHSPLCERLLVRSLRILIRGRPDLFRRAADGELPTTLAHVRAPELNLAGELRNASGPDITGADLAFAELHRSDLRRCTLDESKGYQVDLTGANLDNAQLRRIQWHEATGAHASFRHARMAGAKLSRARLDSADFHFARLQDVDFTGAELHSTKFNSADITGASFRGARLNETTMKSLRKARNWNAAAFDTSVRAELASEVQDAGP